MKRFWVQDRMLAGRSAFNLLQGNLEGCVPGTLYHQFGQPIDTYAEMKILLLRENFDVTNC